MSTPQTSPPAAVAGIRSGAAFLMAVSAIGPGFLTQTTQFTARLGASLAFAILVSILIDIGAQLNTWRIICVSGRRAHELADAVFPGLGWALAGVIVLGSFVFNLGNLSGCSLALEALFDLPPPAGVALSAGVALVLFLLPRMFLALDWFTRLLGTGMILMTVYVLVATAPPVGEAARQAIWPAHVDVTATVTLVGGTIGGYIMFSGAHRLLDGGLAGPEHVGVISRASVQGILITGLMRAVLFLAVLGVVASGASLSDEQPVFDAFRRGAGPTGFVLSGLVFWSAAITSVVGCSYTSVTFLPGVATSARRSGWIVGFIVVSLLATLGLRLVDWQPTPLLVAAGTLNGILLPLLFGVVLLAAFRTDLMGDYRHPAWATTAGLLAWLATAFFSVQTIARLLDRG